MTLPVGADIGGYRILAVLGEGGMGTVYLARHPELPRDDAVKVLAPHACMLMSNRAQFAREARLAATLNHPNIVRVYDASIMTDSGPMWIAMQYVAGTDAAEEIRSAGRCLTLTRATSIIVAVADALDYSHQHGFVHRDVKPGNILLADAEFGDQRILLTDFGLARALDDTSTLSTAGMLLVSMSYAAPERLRGEGVDGRSDQYSLAATAFHLIAGHPPFRSATTAGLLAAHLSSPVPALSQHVRVPAALDHVIARAMSKNVDDRYGSCGDFAAALSLAAGAGYRSSFDKGSGRTVRAVMAVDQTRSDPRSSQIAGPLVAGGKRTPGQIVEAGRVRVWKRIFAVSALLSIIVIALVWWIT